MVTLYGAYESPFDKRLCAIATSLQFIHGFTNTALVMDREYRNPKLGENEAVYNTAKSEHYLRVSNVNVFVVYCIAHNESVMHEIDYVCMHARNKIPCCYVVKDTNCPMASLLTGTVLRDQLFADEFDSSDEEHCDELVTKLISARCLTFLYDKYPSLS